MEFKLDSGIVFSYKRLSYQPWYAFAEFVDNSTQAYFDNEGELKQQFIKDGSASLKVTIFYDPKRKLITIEDNSMGMNEDELQHALTLGLKPLNPKGRSKYGLGMKTAAFWFGDDWLIKTSKLGDDKAHTVKLSLQEIGTQFHDTSVQLNHVAEPELPERHYTRIEISNLNRQLHPNTLRKIKDYLRSIYRLDFKSYGLQLFWQKDLLSWDDFSDRLYKAEDGSSYKKEFDFVLSNTKRVHGWVGILGDGHRGRKNVGFSIIKATRVIQGWPSAFKPSLIFGDDEDGVNDLVNQRIVGELYLDDFEVSHTKDAIVWLENELEELNEALASECEEVVYLAKTLRVRADKSAPQPPIKHEAITVVASEIKSGEFKDFLISTQPPEEEVLKSAYNRYKKHAKEGLSPDINIEIGIGNGKIKVLVYFVEKSPFDPYVVIDALAEADTVIVIINALHPHYLEMTNSETLANFIRHCIYDGVAEWKAIKLINEIQPHTVKNLKDGLLRVPFTIKQNMAPNRSN
jgi:hypothetical protein